MLSRIFAGARISLSVGFIGVFLSFTLGIIFGGISGYFGGVPDLIIQRIIEVLRSFPSIPLWMGLSAALPMTWSPLRVYFAITLILSLISWIGVARAVRGKLLSLREEDFATAAYLAGASRWRIIYKHLMPSFMSHIIVTITLRIPGVILGETALSYLGLGLRPPVVSWGILLKECQNVQDVAHHPWLLLPVLFLVVVILSFNFMGDGLRDAADPYSS
jgi:peptide/nickel transport system permease protein